MFKKRDTHMDNVKSGNYEKNIVSGVSKNASPMNEDEMINKSRVNAILKGSKLIGDINVTCDLELSGDVEGNITSHQKSNVRIKGNCKGSIKTDEGNVEIEGHMSKGDIIAGGDVNITGKFLGGRVEAKGKIHVNGEFNGRLQGNEIEMGSRARGRGELLYKEFISISRGADVEVQISKLQGEGREVKKGAAKKVIEFELPLQKKSQEQ